MVSAPANQFCSRVPGLRTRNKGPEKATTALTKAGRIIINNNNIELLATAVVRPTPSILSCKVSDHVFERSFYLLFTRHNTQNPKNPIYHVYKQTYKRSNGGSKDSGKDVQVWNCLRLCCRMVQRLARWSKQKKNLPRGLWIITWLSRV